MNKKLDLKMSESDKKLLIIFLGICLLAASYFFVFSKGMSKAQSIETENEQKEQKVMQLESKIAREKQIRKETAELKEKQEEIKNKYPVDVTEEKAMSIFRDIEKKIDFKVSQLSFAKGNSSGSAADTSTTADSSDSESTDSDLGTTDSSADTSASAVVQGQYMAVTVSYTASYSGLKKFNQYVNKNADRMTVPAITSTFDSETGKLLGTLTLNVYYLPNNGKTYEEPDTTGVADGVKNIFGSK
ncbi:hypothetical protein KQI69_04860 [Eubacterium sp. MSJ-13]|uniref:hypothetical protein n=1 Tax=Eubacterium sp. MSJ-13 TaxID=2841513 RepID=UPI001C0F75EF|nr:hypothetical protein [Eubacterium sp. MSJ-13]MBU5478531.1 hypothetical protein [Eubacterium sp. MSJ-13]